MIEVRARLRFTTPCLGNRRCRRISRFLQGPDGRVIFLPTWWLSLMLFASKLLHRHQRAVKDIAWDPSIWGSPQEYRRYYAPGRYAIHEAFSPGQIIEVAAVLPDEIPLADFEELLALAGRFRGISPFHQNEEFGRFEVVDVLPRRRGGDNG